MQDKGGWLWRCLKNMAMICHLHSNLVASSAINLNSTFILLKRRILRMYQ